MDDSEFHRLKRLPPYVFAEVNAMKARLRATGFVRQLRLHTGAAACGAAQMGVRRLTAAADLSDDELASVAAPTMAAVEGPR